MIIRFFVYLQPAHMHIVALRISTASPASFKSCAVCVVPFYAGLYLLHFFGLGFPILTNSDVGG